LLGTVVRQINDEETEKITMNLGEIPIMVRSKHCHLYNLNGQQMVNRKEDSNEYGGYFVLNGLEKMIRMLII
jgi:DNA-directed RNA polymerase I subunit RPA2